MPNTAQLIQMLSNWLDWMHMCIGLPITAPVCRSLWVWIMYVSAAIGLWLVFWVVWRMIDYRLKYNVAIRAQMERERIAEPEVMAQHRFKEAGDVAEDVTDPNLARKIREELDRQRLAKMPAQSQPKT